MNDWWEDGTLRPFTTIWVVRVGDDLYGRSYRGRSGGWFRHAQLRHRGRIRAGWAKAMSAMAVAKRVFSGDHD